MNDNLPVCVYALFTTPLTVIHKLFPMITEQHKIFYDIQDLPSVHCEILLHVSDSLWHALLQEACHGRQCNGIFSESIRNMVLQKNCFKNSNIWSLWIRKWTRNSLGTTASRQSRIKCTQIFALQCPSNEQLALATPHLP